MAQNRASHLTNWFQSPDKASNPNPADTLKKDDDQCDSSTIDTVSTRAFDTPTQSVVGEIGLLGEPTVPTPGTTFIIRSVSCQRVLTLLSGRVVLATLNTRGSVLWECIETKGWLGFRNVVSNKILGHDKHGRLRCSVDKHLAWENFCLRPEKGGGYSLLMQHYDKLWCVDDNGANGLIKVEKNKNGVIWEFIEVDNLASGHEALNR